MAQPKLIKRLGQWWQGKAAGDAPDYGQSAWSNDRYSEPLNYRWGRSRDWASRIDYSREVGSLDCNSLVMAVVNYTGIRLPEAKPAIKRTDAKGKFTVDYQHPAATLIRRPNPYNTWANYAHVCSLSWWIAGNVYFKKVRNKATGELLELWYLPHWMIEPRWPGDNRSPEVRDGDPFLAYYQFNAPGNPPELIPAADVLHLKRNLSQANPRLGIGAFDPLIKELYGDDKMAQFTAAIMRNMGIQVPLLSPKERTSIKPEDAAHLKAQWMQKTTGEHVGEPVINSIPLDVEKFGFSPQELDLTNLRLIPESRVSAVTGIPAATLQFLVGLQNGTSYASSEQSRQQGYEEVIIPLQNAWAEEFKWQLLSEFDDAADAEFIFDTTDVRVLQEDRDAKYKRTADAFRAGITTLNEARESLDKDGLGTDGDFFLVPSLNTPMTLEALADAAQPSEDEPLDASVITDTEKMQLAQVADIDGWMNRLESEMREFMRREKR